MPSVLDYLKKLIQPGSGVSTMRVMSLGALAVGSIIALVGLFLKLDLLGLSALCGVFVGASFTGKAAQKKTELNKPQE